jgi:hypothetical protein
MFKPLAVSALTMATLLAASATAEAQAGSDVSLDRQPRWNFIVTSGTMVPTGTQRDAIKRGALTVAQLSYLVHPALAVIASAGWTRTRDIASAGDPKLDMFNYDVGAELRANRWLADGPLSFSPFAGAGAGGRSYDYRSGDVDATHNLAAYASAGGEVGVGSHVTMRVEARDYVTDFKPLTGSGPSDRRNDLSLIAGLRIKVR